MHSLWLMSLALILAILACSSSYLTAGELSATLGPSAAINPGVLDTPQPTVLPTQAQATSTQAQTPEATYPTPTGVMGGGVIDPPQPLASATPLFLTPTPLLSSTPGPTVGPPILYYTQAGDTLPAIAIRFGVQAGEIQSQQPIPDKALIDPGQLLLIPQRLIQVSNDKQLMPDSEVVFSPSAIDFDVNDFVKQAGGYLSQYQEYLGSTGWTSGADVVKRVAIENSVNPRLLLALLEHQSHWVYGKPGNLAETDYPVGYVNANTKGLYQQLTWATSQLFLGYYGWREGILTELTFPDGSTLHPAPSLNAGTVALQYFFSRLDNQEAWSGALYDADSLTALHERMFGNAWLRAQTVEPLFPATLTQPPLILPFMPGQIWSFTGGPHGAWEIDGARAALDFAPASTESGCVEIGRLGGGQRHRPGGALGSRPGGAGPGRRRARTDRLVDPVPAHRHRWVA